jgi:Arc/MetJ-type ribon-helix-helix transcriptional regulator
MPKTRSPKSTDQVSVTLPSQALDMIEGLRKVGLYGTTRGEIIRTLVLARLEDLISKSVIKPPAT